MTKEVFNAIRERQQAIKEELAFSAGVDSLNDRFRAGAVQAYQDLFDITHEEVQ